MPLDLKIRQECMAGPGHQSHHVYLMPYSAVLCCAVKLIIGPKQSVSPLEKPRLTRLERIERCVCPAFVYISGPNTRHTPLHLLQL